MVQHTSTALPSANRHGVIIGCLCLCIFLLTGCGTYKEFSGPNSYDPWSRPNNPPNVQLLLQAGQLAQSKIPDGFLVFIENQTNDAATWETRIINTEAVEQEIKTDTNGVIVLVGPTVFHYPDDQTQKLQNQDFKGLIDYRQAVKRILSAVTDGSVTKLQLVNTQSLPIWEASVWDTQFIQHKLSINAQSGAIISDTKVS